MSISAQGAKGAGPGGKPSTVKPSFFQKRILERLMTDNEITGIEINTGVTKDASVLEAINSIEFIPLYKK